LKQEYDLAQLLFNFTLEYAIWRVQVNPDGLKLNGIRQLPVYVDDVNIFGGSVHSIKKNTEALVDASKEIGLEVNADKPKYSTWSCLEMRIQDKITELRLVIVPLKGWKISNIWEQP
jgi:hypothetical protein